MDISTAFNILELNQFATSDAVEHQFRKLAHDAHPDRGGDHEGMARLNEARDVALKTIAERGAMVPVGAIEAFVEIYNRQQDKKRETDARVEVSRQQLKYQSTNGLYRHRMLAGVLSALAAAVVLVGKDIPKQIFFETISREELNAQKQRLVNYYDPRIKEAPVELRLDLENTRDNQIKNIEEEFVENSYRSKHFEKSFFIFALSFSIFLAIGVWFVNYRIAKIEGWLKILDEHTASKTLLFQLLKDLLKEKIQESWSLAEFSISVEKNIKALSLWRALANEIGRDSFARYLLERGCQNGLLSVRDQVIGADFVEIYSVKTPSLTS